MNKPFCILFVGPIGSSKTPIAYYLSSNLNLPIFNNDIIRTEVREDLLTFDETEFEKRRIDRLMNLGQAKTSFILDSSIDRRWPTVKNNLEELGLKWFIISMDLSKDLLVKIWKAKEYDDFESLDRTIKDHEKFLKEYSEDIGLSINDKSFPSRLELCLSTVRDWIKK